MTSLCSPPDPPPHGPPGSTGGNPGSAPGATSCSLGGKERRRRRVPQGGHPLCPPQGRVAREPPPPGTHLFRLHGQALQRRGGRGGHGRRRFRFRFPTPEEEAEAAVGEAGKEGQTPLWSLAAARGLMRSKQQPGTRGVCKRDPEADCSSRP